MRYGPRVKADDKERRGVAKEDHGFAVSARRRERRGRRIYEEGLWEEVSEDASLRVSLLIWRGYSPERWRSSRELSFKVSKGILEEPSIQRPGWALFLFVSRFFLVTAPSEDKKDGRGSRQNRKNKTKKEADEYSSSFRC